LKTSQRDNKDRETKPPTAPPIIPARCEVFLVMLEVVSGDSSVEVVPEGASGTRDTLDVEIVSIPELDSALDENRRDDIELGICD
jgi:hypothetical protein